MRDEWDAAISINQLQTSGNYHWETCLKVCFQSLQPSLISSMMASLYSVVVFNSQGAVWGEDMGHRRGRSQQLQNQLTENTFTCSNIHQLGGKLWGNNAKVHIITTIGLGMAWLHAYPILTVTVYAEIFTRREFSTISPMPAIGKNFSVNFLHSENFDTFVQSWVHAHMRIATHEFHPQLPGR